MDAYLGSAEPQKTNVLDKHFNIDEFHCSNSRCLWLIKGLTRTSSYNYFKKQQHNTKIKRHKVTNQDSQIWYICWITLQNFGKHAREGGQYGSPITNCMSLSTSVCFHHPDEQHE